MAADGATVAASILAAARFFNGGNYVANAEDPSVGFDCSSFVQYLYGKAGIQLPRRTWDQVNTGISVDEKSAAPGDLVFFNETGADAPGPGGSPWGHVGIYLGNGQMIDAANPQAGIRIENVQGFSPVNQFVFRRVIPNYAGTGDTGITTPGMSTSLSDLTKPATGWDDSSLAASMGLNASLFNSVPELKKLINSPDIAKLDPSTAVGQARFTAALQATQWYKQHTDQQRKWDLLATSDPGEAKQQFISSLGNVIHTAASMGVQLSTQQEWILASQNASLGLTADELKFSIAANFKTNKSGFYGGDAGKLADDIRTNAQNYGMPMSAIDVGKAVFQVINGKSSEEDVTNQMKQYATSMFPGAAPAIAAGKTVADVAQPYLQSYQQILEQNPTQVDLTKDPLIRQALAYKDPNVGSSKPIGSPSPATLGSSIPGTPVAPTTGPASAAQAEAPGVMPLWQFEQKLKQDPRWLGTDNAQQSVVGAGLGVLKDMGLSA